MKDGFIKYVYLIQSLAVPDQRYIGIAANRMSGFEPIMPADRLIRPSIVLERPCCFSVSKMTRARSKQLKRLSKSSP
jgi:hypothetical protein